MPGKFSHPLDFYEFTMDWVENSGLNKEEILFDIYPEIPFPKAIKREERRLIINRQQNSSKGFVVMMPRGRVLEDRAVISPDNKLLWDVSVEWEKHPRDHSIFKAKELPPILKTNKTTALLTHPAAYNYYHWMLEALARIHLIQQSGIKIDQYIVNHKSLHFQLETLPAFGIPLDKIIQPTRGFHLEAKYLVVPSYINLPCPWSCSYVRHTLLSRMNVKKPKYYQRIYIRRRRYRKVVNEKTLLRYLKKYGFKSVDLEKMPLHKQASIFHGADIIIAPHGAGLANLIFCRPGTTVIEFFSSSYLEPHYWLLSRFLNLDYHCMVEKRKNPHHFWAGHDNMSIDVKRLLKLLKKLKKKNKWK